MGSDQLLMLPGWGMPQDIWVPFDRNLSSYFDLSYICWDDVGTVNGFREKVLKTIFESPNKPLSLLGWSLGSLVALDIAADYPDQIARIILISGTSRFTIDKAAGYLAGWPLKVVVKMKANLDNDQKNTLRNFYSSMFFEDESGQNEAIRFLRLFDHFLFKQSLQSLLTGLDYLMETDCRDKLKSIKAPILLINGALDRICPVDASEYILSQVSTQTISKVLPYAGHMPFFTYPEECLGYIKQFITDTSYGGPDD
jgi:pimeloyl-[acyl-carrier protein] methyl ester esterase